MADFDLTQTDQQVQNILNDAQGAMGASAQTTLTTEYVMLKDTSGVYHKILKSSFTEAIRDVLAGLLVNNDKGTTINQIAAIASGDFGSITPANLASVLGEAGAVTAFTGDIDTLKSNGKWQVYNTATGTKPSSVGFLLEVHRAGDYVSQTAFEPLTTSLWVRCYLDRTGETWTPWCSCDNFGCNTPQDLASLLGAAGLDGRLLTADANTIYDGRFFARNKIPESYHIPENYGYLHARSVEEGGYIVIYQSFAGISTDHCLYVRSGSGGTSAGETITWSSWARDDNFGCNTLAELKAALANV